MEAGSTQVLQQLSSGDFTNLVTSCEELELAIQEELCDTLTPEQINQIGVLYAVHILAYLLESRLSAARFLWKRMPTIVQQHPQVVAAHGVLTACWRRQYSDFFNQLRTNLWDPTFHPIVTEVVTKCREQLLDKIGNGYKVITIERMGSMLGLEVGDVHAACAKRGWTIDAAGHVSPMPIKTGEDLMQMGETQLKKLAEYVAYLEQPQCRI